MKKFAVGVAIAGLAMLTVGLNAGAVTSAPPSVTPSSGSPGFTFTVTVAGCALQDSITFSFPPNPPSKSVVCAESSPPPPATTTTTTTTTPPTTEATTTTTTEATTTTTTEPCEEIPQDEEYDELQVPCCDERLLTAGLRSAGVDPCVEGLRNGLARPAQTTSGGTASATFVAPRQPGTYQGTVTSSAGPQSFSVTVLAAPSLPATGSDTNGLLSVIAVLLVASGASLFVVARVRKPHTTGR